MSTIKVNTVTTRSGSTLTLGESGKTVQLATGASQSGFGRTGTVNWVTTKKTANFTAVSGEGYFCDTAAVGAFTLTLPSSPSAGDIVGFKDYNGNFATANLTIGRNGSPINGANAADVTIETAGASILLVYVDASQGWVATQDDESIFAGESFMVATGGTITECGNDKIHTFTGPGTFTVCSVASCAANNLVSYMVVAGGGGSAGDRGGAGGAGGFRELKSPATGPYTASPLDGYPTPGNRITVTATGFPIQVGGGGPAKNTPPFTIGASGSVSTFSTISSAGGGGGGRSCTGANGGSGGASGSNGSGCTARAGGSGNTPPTTPPQGNNAGTSYDAPAYAQGGGGGATAVGGNATAGQGGNGGAGATTSINGSATAFAGGGGGGADPPSKGIGGAGGGGNGASGPYPGSSVAAENGTDNTGGGGGGSNGGGGSVNGGNGGSGIVIIRYRFQA